MRRSMLASCVIAALLIGAASPAFAFAPQPEPPKLLDGWVSPLEIYGFAPQPEPPKLGDGWVSELDIYAFAPQPEPPKWVRLADLLGTPDEQNTIQSLGTVRAFAPQPEPPDVMRRVDSADDSDALRKRLTSSAEIRAFAPQPEPPKVEIEQAPRIFRAK